MASESAFPILIGSGSVAVLSGIISLIPRLSWLGIILWSPVWIAISLLVAFAINLGISYALDYITGDKHSLDQLRSQRIRSSFQTPPFATPAAWEAAAIKARWSKAYTQSPTEEDGWTKIDNLPTAIRSILSFIKRDFILPWYSRISDSPTFPDALDSVILSAVSQLGDRTSKVDLPDLVVSKFLPQITHHLSEYRKVEHLLRSTSGFSLSSSSPSKPQPPNTTVDPTAIIQSHFPCLHPSLPASSLSNTLPAVEAHLRTLIGPALQLLFPEEESKSETVMIIATEVLTCVVGLPIIELLSDPDFWNRILDDQAGKYIEERKQVTQLRAALDSSTSLPPTTPRKRSLPPTAPSPRAPAPHFLNERRNPAAISSSTDSKDFDVFLRSISKIKTVAEAKRLRWDIEREIRAVRGVEEAQGVGGREGRAHVGRLESARRKVDRKLAALNGGSQDPAMSTHPTGEVDSVSLKEILTNPASMGYFLEFMERRRQSRLPQFWMMVESFKNPLEDVDSSDEGDLDEIRSLTGRVSGWTTARDDLEMVWSSYLAEEAPGGKIELSEKVVRGIRNFVVESESGEDFFSHSERRLAVARKAIFQGQKEVYNRILEDHYPDFQRGGLYVKAVAEVKRTTLLPSASTSSLPADTGLSKPSQGQFQRHRTSPSGVPFATWLPFGMNMGKPAKRNISSGSAGASPKSMVEEDSTPRRDGGSSSTFDISSPSSSGGLHRTRSWSFESSPASRMSGSKMSSPRPSLTTPGDRALDFLVGTSTIKASRPLFAADEPENVISKESLDVLRADGRAIDEDEEYVQVERMEAIQAALTSIIQVDDARQKGNSMNDSFYAESDAGTYEQERPVFSNPKGHVTKTLNSSAFPPFVKRRPVSISGQTDSSEATPPPAGDSPAQEQAMKADRPVFDREVSVDPSEPADDKEDELEYANLSRQIAVPGDLHLAADIARLSTKITKLSDQDQILDKLIRAAELTGKQHELNLLVRSQKDLRRETRALNFQRSQFEQQEKDNRLVPGRTRITVPRTYVADQGAEKNVTRYLIEIQQYGEGDQFIQGWVIARRYNEFWDLNQDLKESYQMGSDMRQRNIDLPGKRLVTAMSSSFLDERRTGLEAYLQSLVTLPVACKHPALLAFLSRQTNVDNSSRPGADRLSSQQSMESGKQPKNAVKSLLRTVTTSLDDLFLGPTMLDTFSDRLNRQTAGIAEELGAGIFGLGARGIESLMGGFDVGTGYGSTLAPISSRSDGSSLPSGRSADHVDMLKIPTNLKPLEDEAGVSSFTAPICDLLIELFDLKDSYSLRKQALLILMQQVAGGAIEKKVRETLKERTSSPAVERYLKSFSDIMWPEGKPRVPSAPRTAEEKLRTQTRAARKMQTLMPDLATNMIGRSNTRKATQRAFSSIQAKILCQHLVLTFIDLLFAALFPELDIKAKT